MTYPTIIFQKKRLLVVILMLWVDQLRVGRSLAKEKTFFFFQEIKRFNNTRLFRMKITYPNLTVADLWLSHLNANVVKEKRLCSHNHPSCLITIIWLRVVFVKRLFIVIKMINWKKIVKTRIYVLTAATNQESINA